MENNTNNTQKKNIKIYKDYDIFPGNIRLIENKTSRIIDRDAAIELARNQNMNLVQVAYNKNENPKAICKIIDYSKHLYEQKKREKEEKRKTKIANAEAKEIIYSIRIDEGDKKTKTEHARKFLIEDKMKVKITVKLSRREMNLLGMAKDLMRSVLDNLNDIAEMDSNPSFNSGVMSCILRPKNR